MEVSYSQSNYLSIVSAIFIVLPKSRVAPEDRRYCSQMSPCVLVRTQHRSTASQYVRSFCNPKHSLDNSFAWYRQRCSSSIYRLAACSSCSNPFRKRVTLSASQSRDEGGSTVWLASGINAERSLATGQIDFHLASNLSKSTLGGTYSSFPDGTIRIGFLTRCQMDRTVSSGRSEEK